MNAAPNAGIPWDQTPEYLSLTTRIDPQGVVTVYTHPHPAGVSATDFTSFVFGQDHIHIDNWPDVRILEINVSMELAYNYTGHVYAIPDSRVGGL